MVPARWGLITADRENHRVMATGRGRTEGQKGSLGDEAYRASCPWRATLPRTAENRAGHGGTSPSLLLLPGNFSQELLRSP